MVKMSEATTILTEGVNDLSMSHVRTLTGCPFLAVGSRARREDPIQGCLFRVYFRNKIR